MSLDRQDKSQQSKHAESEYLTRRLDKVALDVRAREARKARLAAQLVHDVTELVKERLDLGMQQQRRLLGRASRKVRHTRGDRSLPLPVGRAARRLQAKARGVAKLARARMHVEVEMADQLAARRVVHLRGASGSHKNTHTQVSERGKRHV